MRIKRVVKREYFAIDRKRRKKVIKEVKENEVRKVGIEFLQKRVNEKRMREKGEKKRK